MKTASGRANSAAAWGAQILRVALLTAILAVMHAAHARFLAREQSQPLEQLPLAQVQRIYPAAAAWGESESHGGKTVLDAAGQPLGFVIQTAPASDRFLGFSGPTNCLVAFDADARIKAVAILTSRDTRDHVDLIVRNREFLDSWAGLSWSEAAARTDVDGVAGATLTSLAIAQGLQERLGARARSAKFPKPLTLADARQLFPDAAALAAAPELPSFWTVTGQAGQPLGWLLQTTPAADEIVGYQGPTETRVAIAPDGQIAAIAVGASFDNEPYVTYVRDDDYFRRWFQQYDLRRLSELDLQKSGLEGVSGATMTSLAVARGLVKAAQEHEAARKRQLEQRRAQGRTSWRVAGTIAVVALGLALSFSRLKRRGWWRIAFQCVLIGYLGLINGDLLSLAMFAGWAQSGIPWQNAAGLVVLAAAALALPIARGENFYCSHLCPHGAVQQLLPRRWRMRGGLPPRLVSGLRLIRPALLLWVVIVAAAHLPFSLVDIEPFDAYSWRAAAWPTVAIAIVGIIAALFVPMAYCRYGCPTGAVLDYLRRHGKSHQLGRADVVAAACLLVGIVLLWIR